MSGLQLSALFLFLLNTAGLLLHSQLIPRGRIRAGMFCFYTNQSNLLLTVYELLLLCAGFWPGGRLWAVLTDVRLSCAMALYIWVTHLIYQFVLVPEQKRKGQRFADFGGSFGNICVHYLTPLLVVAQWLFLADKTGLSLLCAVWWLTLPLAYTVYALLRATGGKPIGHTGLLYPYAFMDLKRLGLEKISAQRSGAACSVFPAGLCAGGIGDAPAIKMSAFFGRHFGWTIAQSGRQPKCSNASSTPPPTAKALSDAWKQWDCWQRGSISPHFMPAGTVSPS